MKRKYKGYVYDRRKDRYQSRIEFKRRRYTSPYFHSKEEAQQWYDQKSLELHGHDRVHDIEPMDVFSPDDADIFAHEKNTKHNWR